MDRNDIIKSVTLQDILDNMAKPNRELASHYLQRLESGHTTIGSHMLTAEQIAGGEETLPIPGYYQKMQAHGLGA